MTMNTMTVRVQADQKAGGKMTGAANSDAAGIFPEVFTQESASQQTTSSSVVQSSAGATAKLEKQQAQASDEQVAREAELADEEQDLAVISTLAPEVGKNISEPTLLLVEKNSSRTTSKDATQVADPRRLPGGSLLPPTDSYEQLAQTMTGATHQEAEAASQTANQSISSGKAAQILAEQARVTMSDSVTDAEQTRPLGNKAPEKGDPEWLAQIEHGRRWAQSSLPAAQQAADQGEVSSLSQLEPNTVTDTDTDTDINSQTAAPTELGLMMSTRESNLFAVTTERTSLPDRALTLHGSAEQNARQLAQQAQVVVSQNLQEADIRLNPSELGGLKIQIKMEQGEVQVQFVASSPQAKELIEQAMPRLREMLNQQGMHLGQQGQQSGQQQNQQGQNLWAGQQQNLNQAAQQDQQSQQQSSETTNEGHSNHSATNPDGGDVYQTADELTQRYQSDESKIDFFA